MKDLGVILLAAGLGKRMNSGLPKVLHCLGGKPLFFYPLEIARSLNPKRIAIVVGHGAEEVKRSCADNGINWVFQQRQLGTGHAVGCTRDIFGDFSGDLLILSGDVPLISQGSLLGLLRHHHEQEAVLTFMTAFLDHPTGYGRIVRNENEELIGIVEERDANQAEKKIKEVNAGIYVAAPRFLYPALEELNSDNQQGEHYLPDIVRVAKKSARIFRTVRVEDAREILGINTREELAFMEKTLQERINRKWMEAGVTMKDPETTYIEEGVRIGQDTIIGPNTHLLGHTVIGEDCRIEGNAYIFKSRLGNGVKLRFSVVLNDCDVGDEVEVGPFAHLRPGTVLKKGVHIGTFVEVKNSSIGERTQANHLSYIGDADIGTDANIGAGMITCNYDGFNNEKHRTKIGNRVQVGSDTTLVAPITIPDDVYIATATTVRYDEKKEDLKQVPPGALVYNERLQKTKENWMAEKQAREEQRAASEKQKPEVGERSAAEKRRS